MSKNNDAVPTCIIAIIFIVLLAPVVGLFLIVTASSDEERTIGFIILTISIIVWIYIGFHI